MKTITLSYTIPVTKTFNIPQSGKWYKFFKALEKDECARSEADWEILESASIAKFIALNTGISENDLEVYDIEVENYT